MSSPVTITPATGPDARLRELGIQLPAAPRPLAAYVPIVVRDGVAYLSGQIPMEDGRPLWQGRLGSELTPDEGKAAARRCALQALAVLKGELGTLDRVRQILKMTVYVASAPTFVEQPAVANGASEVLLAVFGDAGKHARVAVGTSSLPVGVPVEVDLVVSIAS